MRDNRICKRTEHWEFAGFLTFEIVRQRSGSYRDIFFKMHLFFDTGQMPKSTQNLKVSG